MNREYLEAKFDLCINQAEKNLQEEEIAGECDKCANSYDLSSRDNRCGDCGNCDTCCTHKGEVA